MSRTQVYKWFARFKHGREDLNDDKRSVHQKLVIMLNWWKMFIKNRYKCKFYYENVVRGIKYE